MKKTFVFVNLSIECGYNTGVNHGIAYLVPLVKKHSYDVSCMNIRHEISGEEFRRNIDNLNPSIVAFSLTSQQERYLIKYSHELKSYPQILQISGGVGSTLDPEGILYRSAVKGTCVGEGEIPLDNLLNNIEKRQDLFKTAGFYWNRNGKIEKTSLPQFQSDLSSLDFPDYSIFERDVVVFKGRLKVIISRGCPFNCHFCCNKALSSVYDTSTKYFRVPSVEYSIQFLEEMVKRYPEINIIDFEDDLLIANKGWIKEFSEEYRNKINIPYRMCARVESITEDILKALKRSGCNEIFLGLESGNEQLRKNLLNKKFDNSLLIDKCKIIKAARLDLFTFNIVGFPFETKENMEETFQLNKKVAPNNGVCTFFFPYKGTKLYKTCENNGLLKSEEEMLSMTNFLTRPGIKMSKEQEKECITYKKRMTLFFARQSYLSGMSHLPSGATKYAVAIFYWVRYLSQKQPFLLTINQKLKIVFFVRRLATVIGIKKQF